MPNRTLVPPLHHIQDIRLPDYKQYKLDNGTPVFAINMGTQEILKLEIIFFSGRQFEQKQLTGRATASQLKEGTRHYTSAQIAGKIDFYGAALQIPANLDTSNIVFYCLNKHFANLIPLLSEMLTAPVFPEKELEVFIKNSQQRLQVDLTKNDVVAYRIFTEAIYGTDHPYGYNSTKEKYAALTRNDLTGHFEKNYVPGNCSIVISGRLKKDTLSLVNQYFGQHPRKGKNRKRNDILMPFSNKSINIPRPNTLQTAIRIGRRLFNRSHPDYPGMLVLDTILGGFFGSRLMQNIREEKGFTYNIYSSIDPLLYDGYFYIGTEVKKESAPETIHEIHTELQHLKEKPVGDKELQLVRNYLLGNFLSSLDGPFNIAGIVKRIIIEDLRPDYFDNLVETVQSISAEEIQRLAQKYLNSEDMFTVIVG